MKLKVLSLKWKLFIYITAFSLLMLFLIWLFQIAFLNTFYRSSKLDELKTAEAQIESSLGTNKIASVTTSAVEKYNLCIKIINVDNGTQYDVDHTPTCVLHRLSTQEISQLYLKARDNNGEFMASFGGDDDNLKKDDKDERVKSIIYTKIVSTDSDDYVIMLNTFISPVNATVGTLQRQLIYLSVLFGLASLIFASIISKNISKPIAMTNESAKQLAKGDIDIHFEEDGYKEIIELNQTLDYAATELSKVEKLQHELIANISHDLRTPLTMITGYAEVIRDLPGENTPENVQIIIDEANRLASLVNDILDISKLQSGTEYLDISIFSITQTIKQIMKRYTKLTEQDGYQIQFEEDQDVYVQGNELKITQVIYNLVNNAINYTGEDKRVLIRQQVNNHTVRIEVIDTGEGIPTDVIDSVWDRYYKVDKNHRQANVGTGLGLSIVKNILSLHHMPFGVESTVGEGSIFWFEMVVANQK